MHDPIIQCSSASAWSWNVPARFPFTTASKKTISDSNLHFGPTFGAAALQLAFESV